MDADPFKAFRHSRSSSTIENAFLSPGNRLFPAVPRRLVSAEILVQLTGSSLARAVLHSDLYIAIPI